MSIRQTAAALGIAAAIAGLGGAAVYAATDTHGAGPHGGPPGMAGPGGGPGRDHFDRPDPATVRSEAVLAGRDGGYTTSLTQNGTITELTGTSVTVRSADGFTQSYTLSAGAKPPFGVEDHVLVRATRNLAERPTLTSIDEAPAGRPTP